MRLQKFMAACGAASRRESERMIAAGRVLVNGAVAQVGQSVDPESDVVTLDGAVIAPERKVYIVLNKPAGALSTTKDTHGRDTVIDCLPNLSERVFPVGRLDQDVEGVLLLTNDGELANRLMHPRYEVEKLYAAWVEGSMDEASAERLAAGVELEDGVTAPAKVAIVRQGHHATLIHLTIHEGRKREVKRMCAAVGHPVRTLRRLSIGGVSAHNLRPGDWRYLSDQEVAALRALTGL